MKMDIQGVLVLVVVAEELDQAVEMVENPPLIFPHGPETFEDQRWKEHMEMPIESLWKTVRAVL